MSTLLRRLRGMADAAATWAAAWTIIGSVFRVVWPTESGLGLPTLAMVVGTGLSWILPGVVAGAAFALVLSMSRRSRLEDYSLKRIALWGLGSASAVPLVAITVQSLASGRSVVGVLPVLAQYAVAGGICAAGSFALARRAAFNHAAKKPRALA